MSKYLIAIPATSIDAEFICGGCHDSEFVEKTAGHVRLLHADEKGEYPTSILYHPRCFAALLKPMRQDKVAEFAPFIKRHLARKGEISTEEMAALYEDFHGIELKKEETGK